MSEPLYTTQQVAALLSVSDAYVRIMISRGIAFPKQKIGNSHVFTFEEIERLRHRRRRGEPKK